MCFMSIDCIRVLNSWEKWTQHFDFKMRRWTWFGFLLGKCKRHWEKYFFDLLDVVSRGILFFYLTYTLVQLSLRRLKQVFKDETISQSIILQSKMLMHQVGQKNACKGITTGVVHGTCVYMCCDCDQMISEGSKSKV